MSRRQGRIKTSGLLENSHLCVPNNDPLVCISNDDSVKLDHVDQPHIDLRKFYEHKTRKRLKKVTS